MNDFLDLFFNSGASAMDPGTALLNMAVAFVLSLIMYCVYRLSFSGVAYSKKFNVTLIMLALITTIVMNILGNSLALSMGMVGALSIVRFRTAIKDPRDTAYIFWAITIGLGAGSSNWFMAVVGSLVVGIVAVILSRTVKSDDSYLLIVRCETAASAQVRSAVAQLYQGGRIRSETVTDEFIELVYQIKLKASKESARGAEKIKSIQGVFTVNIVARSGETLG